MTYSRVIIPWQTPGPLSHDIRVIIPWQNLGLLSHVRLQVYYSILRPVFMWYWGFCSPNGDQSGQWRSISMTSQWSFIDITMDNDVVRDIHCDVTMNNDIAICTYHSITIHNDVSMNLFYYVFSAYYVILLWIVWNKCVLPRLIKHSLVLGHEHGYNGLWYDHTTGFTRTDLVSHT